MTKANIEAEMTAPNTDNSPVPPEGCTCGALWTVRGKHGKRDCPLNTDGDLAKTRWAILNILTTRSTYDPKSITSEKLYATKIAAHIHRYFVLKDGLATLQRQAELDARIDELDETFVKNAPAFADDIDIERYWNDYYEKRLATLRQQRKSS